MATFDLLILLIYVTLVVYVAYKARQTVIAKKEAAAKLLLKGKYVLQPGQDQVQQELDRQLEGLNLKGAIVLNLGKSQIIELEQLKALPLNLANQTKTYAVYVDWKESALTNLGGQARSLACVTPNQGQSQSPSLAPPSDRLMETFTVAQETVSPIFDPAGVAKKLKESESCQIWLRLVLKLRTVGSSNLNHLIALTCPYQLRAVNAKDFKDFKDFKLT